MFAHAFVKNAVPLAKRGGLPGPVTTPRLFFLNDFNPTFAYPSASDTDNTQVLAPLAMMLHQVNLRGIGCTYNAGGLAAKTNIQGWFTNVYGADYANWSAKHPTAPSAATINAKVYQGALVAQVGATPAVPNELSEALHTELGLAAAAGEILYVVVGGCSTDVAQWQKDYPADANSPYHLIVGIALKPGFWNYDQDPNASAYLKTNMVPGQPLQNLRFIEMGESYYGMFAGADATDRDRTFPLTKAAGHGAMGDFTMEASIDVFVPGQSWNGFSAGDYSGLLFVLDVAMGRRPGGDPTLSGWGGRYEKNAAAGNNYWRDIQTGQTVNGHLGANTILPTRSAWLADLAQKFDDCCVTPPNILGYDSFEDIGSTSTDIGGRAIMGTASATWANFRPANANPMGITYVNVSDAYMGDTVAASSLYYANGVVGAADGTLEIEAILYTDTNDANGASGIIAAMGGNVSTGTNVTAFISDATHYDIQKVVNGTPTDTAVLQTVLPLVTSKKFFVRLRVTPLGGGQFKYDHYMKYGYASAWTLINTFSDTSSPIDAINKFPGVRLRNTGGNRCYGIVFRIPAGGVPAWGSADKLFGVRVDDATTTGAFETWLGRTVDHTMAFANGSTWSDLLTYAAGEAARGATRAIHWTVGLPTGTTLAQVAAGARDAELTSLANTMANARPSDPIIPVRIWHEFQLTSHPWSAVGVEADYIAAFRHFVGILLKVTTRFRIEWCPNYTTVVSGSPYDPSQAYPGDDYVSVLGMDIYYISAFDSADMQAAFALKLSSQYGLNWLKALGITKSKPLAICEWGINANNAQMYVSSMLEFIQDNNVAYAHYYNVDAGGNFNNRLDLDQYPATGTRFKLEFADAPNANLLTFGKDVSNAAWAKVNVTIAEGRTDPAGGATAESLLETTATAVHDITRTLTKAAATKTYRIDWKAKPRGRNFTRFQVFQNSFGDGTSAYFDVSGSSIGGFFQYGSMGTPIPFNYEDANGYRRVGYEFTATAATDLIIQLGVATADGTDSYAGDITKGLDAWDARLREVA